MSTELVKKRSFVGKLVIIVFVVAAFAFGYMLAPYENTGKITAPVAAEHDHANEKQAAHAEIWTCSMHPQIRLPNPGKCPICFMDLIPLTDTSSETTPFTQLVMTPQAQKLALVQTAEVKRDHAKIPIRMVGLVYEDETRVAALTSRVDGRLDEIYINFTGVHVNQGDPMVMIWSPTLIKSQVELFESIRSEDENAVIRGAEEKLLQLGLTKEQIQEIRKKKKPILNVTLRAPITGVVTKKMAILGQFVKEGTEMFSINDLSHVWIKMDAYEMDLPWIKYGQDVTFTTPALPWRTFTGRVLFIDPTLDMKTRSVKVRVDAENFDYALKPGMFVSAELESEVDAKGKVIKSEWAGKYICPIHPRDEASATPGVCPDSKTALQPASSFGYSDDPHPQLPLVIPATAPLITGKRSIVYVEVPADKPTYDLREVSLGPRAGDKYVVYDGLKEGERVVVKGNFKIDSAMQILGKPSMMSTASATPSTDEQTPSDEEVISRITVSQEFLKELTPVLLDYFQVKKSLAEGDTAGAALAAEPFVKHVAEVKTLNLTNKAQYTWGKLAKVVATDGANIANNKDLSSQRSSFDVISETLVRTLMSFGHAMEGPLYVYYCGDVFDGKGAYWLASSKESTNPYTSVKEAKCASLEETLAPATE